MGWRTISGPLGAQVDQVDSSAVFQYGTRCYAQYYDASSAATTYHGDFVYVKGVASAAAGKWAALNPDNDTPALLPDGHIGGVGVFVSSLVASKSGWVQVTGKGQGLLAAAVADNAILYTTATAGQAGADAASQSEIMGARAAAAADSSSAGNVDVELWWPHCATVASAL
jgi:hypothetical protein